MKKLAPLSLAILAAACGDNAATEAGGDSKAQRYKVELTFTPRTITELRAMGEKVTIANWYYGLAKEGTPEDLREENDQISLGENLMGVDPADQIVSVSVSPFAKDKLKHVDGEPMLLINVYTARKAHPDNLINCGIFDDTLAKAEPTTIEIACDLIKEEPPLPPPPPPPTEPPPDVP
jgi:hypothetical protein